MAILMAESDMRTCVCVDGIVLALAKSMRARVVFRAIPQASGGEGGVELVPGRICLAYRIRDTGEAPLVR